MAALSIHLPDTLQSQLRERAAASGFDNVESYVEAMLIADATGPVLDDEQLESLLLDRLDGPFVDADELDFKQMRTKLAARLNNPSSDDAAKK